MGFHTKRRQKRKELGLCRDCGAPLRERLKQTTCADCFEKESVRNKKRREFNKLKGICIICGKNKSFEGLVTCINCKHRSYRCKNKKFFLYRSTHFNGAFKTNHTAQQFARLWRSQLGLCALTGVKLTTENSELDHIIPKSRGGSHELTNLRWVTKLANRLKRDLLDSELIEACISVVEWAGK